MDARIDTTKYLSSGLGRAMLHLENEVQKSGIEKKLLEIIKIRASQINGCAYCLDMHTKDARAGGETEQRIYALNAWRETPFFSERERVALDWTESVTLVSQTHIPDEAYEIVKAQFSEEEIFALTFAIITINAWNRFAIAFRTPVGTYEAQLKVV